MFLPTILVFFTVVSLAEGRKPGNHKSFPSLEADFRCPAGQAVSGAHGSYSGSAKTRTWDFDCMTTASGSDANSKCNWTETTTAFGPMSLSCPSDSYMNGLKIQPVRHSVKNNQPGVSGPEKSDDEWQLYCCSYSGAATCSNCATDKKPLNPLRKAVGKGKKSGSSIIQGFASEYNQKSQDRQIYLVTCSCSGGRSGGKKARGKKGQNRMLRRKSDGRSGQNAPQGQNPNESPGVPVSPEQTAPGQQAAAGQPAETADSAWGNSGATQQNPPVAAEAAQSGQTAPVQSAAGLGGGGGLMGILGNLGGGKLGSLGGGGGLGGLGGLSSLGGGLGAGGAGMSSNLPLVNPGMVGK